MGEIHPTLTKRLVGRFHHPTAQQIGTDAVRHRDAGHGYAKPRHCATSSALNSLVYRSRARPGSISDGGIVFTCPPKIRGHEHPLLPAQNHGWDGWRFTTVAVNRDHIVPIEPRAPRMPQRHQQQRREAHAQRCRTLGSDQRKQLLFQGGADVQRGDRTQHGQIGNQQRQAEC